MDRQTEAKKPIKIPFKCPVCNGFGTLKYGEKQCQACKGLGYVEVLQDGQKDENTNS